MDWSPAGAERPGGEAKPPTGGVHLRQHRLVAHVRCHKRRFNCLLGTVEAAEGAFHLSERRERPHVCGLGRRLSHLLGRQHERCGYSLPPGKFFSISAGRDYTCGIRDDRSVVCWGVNGSGQATPPAGRFISISAGYEHTCGVRTDHTVILLGRKHSGRGDTTARAIHLRECRFRFDLRDQVERDHCLLGQHRDTLTPSYQAAAHTTQPPTA